MAVKALKEISHNGSKYHCGDTILDITKEEADRLVKLKAGKIIDNKFKRSKENMKKSIVSFKKRIQCSERNWIHGI